MRNRCWMLSVALLANPIVAVGDKAAAAAKLEPETGGNVLSLRAKRADTSR